MVFGGKIVSSFLLLKNPPSLAYKDAPTFSHHSFDDLQEGSESSCLAHLLFLPFENIQVLPKIYNKKLNRIISDSPLSVGRVILRMCVYL